MHFNSTCKICRAFLFFKDSVTLIPKADKVNQVKPQ